MFVGREVDWEVEFAANCEKTARDVGADSGSRVPCVKRHQDAFQGNAVGAALVAKNGEARVEETTDAFNNHRIMVFTG